jgi:hypothetical protein
MMAYSDMSVVPALAGAFSAVDSIRTSVERVQAKWPADRLKTLGLFIDKVLRALNAEIRNGRATLDQISGHLQKLLLFVDYANIRSSFSNGLSMSDYDEQDNRRNFGFLPEASQVGTSEMGVCTGGSDGLHRRPASAAVRARASITGEASWLTRHRPYADHISADQSLHRPQGMGTEENSVIQVRSTKL